MVNQRPPSTFTGVPRFIPGGPRTKSTASTAASSSTIPMSRQTQKGLGLNAHGAKGQGLGKGSALKRHRKIQRDTIQGVTKGDIRRLARRGGIKRISATIYDDIRMVLKQRLELCLSQTIALVEHSGRKTVSVTDVIFILNRLGTPVYGYAAHFDNRHRT